MKHILAALKSRTVWFALILSVLSIGQTLVFQMPIDPIWQGIIGMALAACIIFLRFITNQSVYDK